MTICQLREPTAPSQTTIILSFYTLSPPVHLILGKESKGGAGGRRDPLVSFPAVGFRLKQDQASYKEAGGTYYLAFYPGRALETVKTELRLSVT